MTVIREAVKNNKLGQGYPAYNIKQANKSKFAFNLNNLKATEVGSRFRHNMTFRHNPHARYALRPSEENTLLCRAKDCYSIGIRC